MFRRILGGLACRDWGACAESVPEAFGLARSTVWRRFVRASARRLGELIEWGFGADDGLLVVMDGAKGLPAAVAEVFGNAVQVQQCQWHKRENVVRHLPPGLQPVWRRKPKAAYERPSCAEAKAALRRLEAELRVLNVSAANSVSEGLEETLTLHQPGLSRELDLSFKTTNALESILA